MADRRGKKLNTAKNAGSARDFAAGKKIGRPKQVWVWDAVGVSWTVRETSNHGHWEKTDGEV